MYTPTKYNPDILHRRSIRLYGYDYSCDGLYFVTVCCRNKACSFGEIVDGEMMLNAAGRMVEKCWLAIPTRYRNVILHEYVVMPNHFHAILQIDTVGQMIGAFKSITANEYICGVEKYDWIPFDRKLWQRNYYEHIIRNAESYDNIAEYSITNPARWQKDNPFIQPNTLE